ncbi:hypothetical protein M3Y98_00669200 [Aphelenchoides besseyi]|nr:hypothetical protein M3Y98_00669200 [Aphelenchoides besseyi]KAI6208860.1 hypothetical protein M3Y96_00159800 [Aphelenchoides besseyi]
MPQGILNTTGQQKVDGHVKVPDGPERPTQLAPASSAVDPSKLPPSGNFTIKDEVELLRQGVINAQGQHIQSQAQNK